MHACARLTLSMKLVDRRQLGEDIVAVTDSRTADLTQRAQWLNRRGAGI